MAAMPQRYLAPDRVFPVADGSLGRDPDAR
jgi:hypothetical protein